LGSVWDMLRDRPAVCCTAERCRRLKVGPKGVPQGLDGPDSEAQRDPRFGWVMTNVNAADGPISEEVLVASRGEGVLLAEDRASVPRGFGNGVDARKKACRTAGGPPAPVDIAVAERRIRLCAALRDAAANGADLTGVVPIPGSVMVDGRPRFVFVCMGHLPMNLLDGVNGDLVATELGRCLWHRGDGCMVRHRHLPTSVSPFHTRQHKTSS
jgi:hypothetical protein